MDSNYPTRANIKGLYIMTSTERKIDRIKRNLAYLRLGMERSVYPGDTDDEARGDQEIASWLYYQITQMIDDVDREIIQEATDRRNRLNGKGYSGKAAH